ncbi:hypothetical protein CEXT_138751 [Caerostris extrusa]|uniref:Uncharacterized protein n=1 Tax=Caerostris extrusa TaxID=172846 RepID=A0AAV4R3F0_CAEEX|nr:hypothetical protein CEXT_138751 [Caerostris extrusa]
MIKHFADSDAAQQYSEKFAKIIVVTSYNPDEFRVVALLTRFIRFSLYSPFRPLLGFRGAVAHGGPVVVRRPWSTMGCCANEEEENLKEVPFSLQIYVPIPDITIRH